MYEHILLPYDGSEGAAEILHHASEIAHWTNATIQLLYVADTTRDSVAVVEGDTIDMLEQKGQTVVEKAAKTLDTLGVTYNTDVVQGNPAVTIAEYAKRYDQNLIMMPTHAREGISRHLIGSVCEKVVRLSSVPVLTARMQPNETIDFPYEDILIPTDGSVAATHAAKHVCSVAASVDATVHVLAVVDDGGLSSDIRSKISRTESEQTATDAVETIISEAEMNGVTDTKRHIKHGAPVNEILAYIESNNINAVGMGTTGKRGTDRILLGSVAEKVVRSAPVPVMTIANSNESED
ncbi:universal stress protein [Haloquadratum walsbyi]|jgi:Universal stress protein UspA and related nucleotide-binding proteins|uniref:Universal stress protein UspA related nucleotide-binding protein n=1 Tax=Haloquadratum walsbyi J07HQW2 TaxID=1238425 RepID=U1N2E4_9EURY|nr:universal stress protein [Haloquadratum walsbyi]ERG97049.1 MAG: universal stress protein UspA related nucleotide-binding protein [Haloquadratum walsbyi J07HQW2]